MMVYLMYSDHTDGVLYMSLSKEDALSWAQDYTHDTHYTSWVAEVDLRDWWDCCDSWDSDNVIALFRKED